MSGVFVRTAILFSSFIISALAEDLHLAGIHGDLVPKALLRPSSLSQFPAVEDKSSSSPDFDVGLVTPKPTNEDNTPHITYSNNVNPGTQPLTSKKKRKGDMLGEMAKAKAEEEAKDRRMLLPVSLNPSVCPPPFGSPSSHRREEGRALKKSHTCLLEGLEKLTFPSTPQATNTGDAPGDLSESTALSDGDDGD